MLSPLALGFDLLPARGIATQFDDLLNEGGPFTGIFMHFPMLQEVSPQWALFISRFAYHASDVAESANICILRTLATNPAAAAQLFLPGIDNHPYLPSFTAEGFRWFICTCGQENCVAAAAAKKTVRCMQRALLGKLKHAWWSLVSPGFQ